MNYEKLYLQEQFPYNRRKNYKSVIIIIINEF
jgi:hypothetical protein